MLSFVLVAVDVVVSFDIDRAITHRGVHPTAAAAAFLFSSSLKHTCTPCMSAASRET